jgi:hypothetical protein
MDLRTGNATSTRVMRLDLLPALFPHKLRTT